MSHQLIRRFIVIGLTIVLTSCQYVSPPPAFDLNAAREPIECAQILDDNLLTFPFGLLNLEETELWIRNTYGVVPEKATIITGAFYLSWTKGANTFSTTVYPEKYSTAITVRQAPNPPIVEEVLKCFGEPAYVQAYYNPTPDGPMYTVLELWYPETGLTFRSSTPAQLNTVSPRMPVSISYSKPNTLDEMILARYVVEPFSEEFQTLRNQIKPWSGSLDKITIDE